VKKICSYLMWNKFIFFFLSFLSFFFLFFSPISLSQHAGCSRENAPCCSLQGAPAPCCCKKLGSWSSLCKTKKKKTKKKEEKNVYKLVYIYIYIYIKTGYPVTRLITGFLKLITVTAIGLTGYPVAVIFGFPGYPVISG
jgi:hypothetical protein